MHILVFGICQGSAWAHANAGVDSIDIIGDGNGALAGIETTVGYLRPQDDGQFQWLCHETVTQTDSLITPQYEENENGTMLVHVGALAQARDTLESLYRSEDGCNWHAVSGLTDQQISAKAFDPHQPQRGLALTANDDGTNAVYITTDEGQSWTPTTLSTEVGTFESVRYSRGIEGVVWVSSVNQTASAGWVHRSDDGGLNWTTHPIEGEADSDRNLYITILEADSSDPNTAWVVVGPFLDDTLMRTTDGGATFTHVYEPNADIVDGAQDADGGLWLTLTGNKVIHSEDGDVFKRVNDAPLSLGLETLGSRVVLATRVQRDEPAGARMNPARQGKVRVDGNNPHG